METVQHKEDFDSSLLFYVMFIATVGVLLLFSPGTNGNNLPEFSIVKLLGFLLSIFVSLGVLISPLFWRRVRSAVGLFYWFLCMVFIPTHSIYVFLTVKHLLYYGGAHA